MAISGADERKRVAGRTRYLLVILLWLTLGCDDDRARDMDTSAPVDVPDAGDPSLVDDSPPGDDDVPDLHDPGGPDIPPDLAGDHPTETLADPGTEVGAALEGESCLTHPECTPGLLCHPDTQVCVTCFTSAHCPPGKYCSESHCLNWNCVPGSSFCEDDILVTCSLEGDGPIGHFNCNDGDPCTIGDACEGTSCTKGSLLDCDDGNDCTADACDKELGCTNLPMETACDDQDPCTLVDQCQGVFCLGTGEPDCDDGNPCTDDLCSSPVGCKHVPNQEDCDDDDPCTLAEQCTQGVCTATSVLDCDDQDDCTLDECDTWTGLCTHAAIPQCEPCKVNSECSDGNPCSLDGCDSGTCVHYPSFKDGCCTVAATCDDDNACTLDQCPGAPYGACLNVPVAGEGCCETEVFAADFHNGDYHGFELDPAQGGVGWFLIKSPHASSSPWALYYGDPDTQDYDSGQANAGSATGPELTLPGGVELTLGFSTWLDVEKAVNLDTLSVEASSGGRDYLVWRKPLDQPMKTLEHMSVDLSALQARTMRLRFTFSTMDGLVNDLEGVYLDDIEVTGPCTARSCVTGLDCWSLGVGGTCLAGACDFTTVFDTLGILGSPGSPEGNLDGPYDVAVSPGGDRIFVSDKNHHQVQVFDGNETYQATIGSFGTGDGQLYQPHGLAATSDRLYVADTKNHRVQVFTHTGVLLFGFGQKGDQDGLFNDPKDVALTLDGEVLYVADTSNHRIQVFDKEGAFLFNFGTWGKGLDQLRSPSCVLAAPDFRILVCDTQNHRIQVFDFDGKHLEGIKPANDWALYYPYGAVLRDDGHLLVSDTYHHRVEVLDPAGQVWNAFGSPGDGTGQFNYPMGLAFDPSGRLYVTDATNDRIVMMGHHSLPF